MRRSDKIAWMLACIWLLALVLSPFARGHMMPAQQGTLNIVDNAVYMVLSLPGSAFSGMGVDTNDDGELSTAEFATHRVTIIEAVLHNITLDTSAGKAQLVGVMVSPVMDHEGIGDAVEQITILGRFNIEGASGAMYFHVGLYGNSEKEQVLMISAKRNNQAMEFELSPQLPIGLVNFARYTL